MEISYILKIKNLYKFYYGKFLPLKCKYSEKMGIEIHKQWFFSNFQLSLIIFLLYYK